MMKPSSCSDGLGVCAVVDYKHFSFRFALGFLEVHTFGLSLLPLFLEKRCYGAFLI